jgi:hypothetical protein
LRWALDPGEERRLPGRGKVIMIVMVQHTVCDFDAWKAVFDEHEALRRRHGAARHELYRGLEDPTR